MADAKFSIGQVNITNNLRVIAREVASPTVEVANVIYTTPHPSIRNILITGLNPKTHYFDFYQTTASSGSSPVGTLLATFTIDVGLINQSTIEIIEFIVGDAGAPAHGDVNYINTDLDGIATTHLQVVQRSIGPRSWDDEITLYSGGGFTLLGGELFNEDDRWFITVVKDASVVVPQITTALYEGIKIKSADFTIDSTYYNKLILTAGGTGWIKATMPDLSTIPDFTKFTFNNQDGIATGLIIYVPIGTISTINGISDTSFYLRKYEVVTFIVYQGTLILIDGKGNWDRVGEQIVLDTPKYSDTNIDTYTAKENGQFINIEDEPRLFYWYVNKLPLDYLASSSTTDLGKWFIDMPNNRFRMPSIFNGTASGNVLQTSNNETDVPGFTRSVSANNAVPINELFKKKHIIYNRIL